MRILSCLLLPLFSTLVLAADAAPAVGGGATKAATAATGSATSAAATPAVPATPKPFFGVRIDPNSVALAEGNGLPIAEVVLGSTAQQLGLEAGDRLLAINGQPVKSDEDLKRVLGGSKIGDPITVEFSRAGASQTASGTMLERPRPANWGQEVEKMRSKLENVQRIADQKKKEPSLVELLEMLQTIERDLPKAVAAFKEQYPNGEFDIDIKIKVVSDKTSGAPLKFGNVTGTIPGPTPATGSATAAAGAATKAAVAPATK